MRTQQNPNPSRNGDSCAARRDSRRAFTLVELLAILGVIVLLGMLVVPALANSKSTSARVICADNMRRMGAAANLYANDHGDYLALPNWQYDYQGWLWTNGGYPVIPLAPGQTVYTPNAQVQWAQTQQYYAKGLWYQYMPNIRSYICPSDAHDPTFAVRPNWMCTYVMNGAVCGYPVGNSPQTSCKTTAVWNPGSYLMWEPYVIWGKATGLNSESAEYNEAPITRARTHRIQPRMKELGSCIRSMAEKL